MSTVTLFNKWKLEKNFAAYTEYVAPNLKPD